MYFNWIARTSKDREKHRHSSIQIESWDQNKYHSLPVAKASQTVNYIVKVDNFFLWKTGRKLQKTNQIEFAMNSDFFLKSMKHTCICYSALQLG